MHHRGARHRCNPGPKGARDVRQGGSSPEKLAPTSSALPRDGGPKRRPGSDRQYRGRTRTNLSTSLGLVVLCPSLWPSPTGSLELAAKISRIVEAHEDRFGPDRENGQRRREWRGRSGLFARRRCQAGASARSGSSAEVCGAKAETCGNRADNLGTGTKRGDLERHATGPALPRGHRGADDDGTHRARGARADSRLAETDERRRPTRDGYDFTGARHGGCRRGRLDHRKFERQEQWECKTL